MDAFIQEKIQEAGVLAKSYTTKDFSIKSKSDRNDLLTDADLAVSEFLVHSIQESYPDHHIYSEELADDINPGADWRWVIDPIDGTYVFAHGIPTWCTLIAVTYRGEPKYAAAYSPVTDLLLFADVDRSVVTKNGVPCQMSHHSDLSTCAGYTTIVGTNPLAKEMLDAYSRATLDGLRGHDLSGLIWAAEVATGGMDFFWTNSGKVHDNLPVSIICKTAGAIVTDFDGNEWQEGREDMLAANPELHRQIMRYLNQ